MITVEIHNDYPRKEDERHKRGEFKDECYLNGHLRSDHE